MLDESARRDFMLWMRDLGRESDRAFAVLAAAYLEEALGDLLREVMRPEDGEDLLRGSPLRGMWARTRVAYAFGLISEAEAEALDGIRSVRNDFAHEHGEIRFTDGPIGEKIAHLELPGVPEPTLRFDRDNRPSGVRQHFHAIALSLASVLRRRQVLASEVDPPRPPGDVAADEDARAFRRSGAPREGED